MTTEGGEVTEGNKGGTFAQALKAVLWSFLGVRKRRDLEADATRLNPLHVLIVALLAAAMFIGVLILVVRAVVG